MMAIEKPGFTPLQRMMTPTLVFINSHISKQPTANVNSKPVGTEKSFQLALSCRMPISWKSIFRKLSSTLSKLSSSVMVVRSPTPVMGQTILGLLYGRISQKMDIKETMENAM